MGCKSNIGGWSSASSIAVIPTAQRSQSWLYPPFLSTAATSGAILKNRKMACKMHLFLDFKGSFYPNIFQSIWEVVKSNNWQRG